MKQFVHKGVFMAFLFLVHFGQGQMKVRENDDKTIKVGVITVEDAEMARCETVGKSYYFTMAKADWDYDIMKEWGFAFLGIDNAFEDFYRLIADGFKRTPSRPIIVDFNFYGDTVTVGIVYEKTQFETKVRFYDPDNPHAGHFSNWFTKEQINSLFGK